MSTGTFSIGFHPEFDSSPESGNDSSSTSPLSFIPSGLERRFVYRGTTGRTSIPPKVRELYVDIPDTVGVIRPKGYEGLELKPGSGSTEEPHSNDSDADAGITFFPASTSDGSATTIRLRYRVQPTSVQTLVLSYASKAAAGLFAPFIAVMFFTRDEKASAKKRTLVMWILGVSELGILAALIYFAFKVQGESAGAAVGDWTIVFVSAIGTAIPLWMKREPSDQPLAVKV